MLRAFHVYVCQADREIFTTFEKLTDPKGKYKRILDHRAYFLAHKEGQVTMIKTENALNMYILKTFGEVNTAIRCYLKSW